MDNVNCETPRPFNVSVLGEEFRITPAASHVDVRHLRTGVAFSVLPPFRMVECLTEFVANRAAL